MLAQSVISSETVNFAYLAQTTDSFLIADSISLKIVLSEGEYKTRYGESNTL